MADAITVSAPISGTDRTLTFETGKLAGQADGAVLARIGDTIILVTATAARNGEPIATMPKTISKIPHTIDNVEL